MFGNLINLHDFAVLARWVRTTGTHTVLQRLLGSGHARVRAAWAHTGPAAPAHWWEIPAVEKRWNQIITGEQDMYPSRYASDKYLNKRPAPLLAMSPGCGSGGRELRWLQACPAMTVEGYDLSPQRVAQATERVRQQGLANRARFAVADVNHLRFHPATFDVVMLEGALHHFRPVHQVLNSIHTWLKPDGLLIVDEFVGPSRFQWTTAQLDVVAQGLAMLPERYRTTPDGRLKIKAYRPGRLSMYLSDPSEAAESQKILPALQSTFRILERHDYGGAVLPQLFRHIAHNFLGDDPETAYWLQQMFLLEDQAMQSGLIPSDYTWCLCSPR